MIKLIVEVSPSSGMPQVQVPAAWFWDLRECLAWHGVRATYEYQDASHFVVHFSSMDQQRAQAMLDLWSRAMAATQLIAPSSGLAQLA